MSKVIGLIFILVLFLSITVSQIYAAEEGKSEDSKVATAPATPTYIKYDLAYPGLLPDHPLYKLKVARDKIIDFLTTDPRKKIDYYLLKADKEILATAMLIDKNNLSLAEQTALKAEHNFTLLNSQFSRLSKKPEDKFFVKLKTAALKHQEVLESLVKRLPPGKQKIFRTVLGFSKSNLTTLEKYQKINPKKWPNFN